MIKLDHYMSHIKSKVIEQTHTQKRNNTKHINRISFTCRIQINVCIHPLDPDIKVSPYIRAITRKRHITRTRLKNPSIHPTHTHPSLHTHTSRTMRTLRNVKFGIRHFRGLTLVSSTGRTVRRIDRSALPNLRDEFFARPTVE